MSSSQPPDAAPVDPPIPVPDVAGADATPRVYRGASTSRCAQRLIVDSSAIADLGLRTALASVVGAAMLPAVAHAPRCGSGAAAPSATRCGSTPSWRAAKDPDAVVPSADRGAAGLVAPGQSDRRVDRQRPRAQHPVQEQLQAINPAMREHAAGYARNNVVHAQHWRHDDGPHPTLCVIHGFMGSAYLFNGLFFSLPWFYRSGYDILLYTLPFHGRRAEKYSPYSGYGYFANGFAGFAEAMAQAVHDFRSVIDYLEFTGVDRIALTGMSLGGYTSALIACVDDRIQAVIPNVPVVMPETAVRRVVARQHAGCSSATSSPAPTDELSTAAAMFHSPLNYARAGAQGPAADHRRASVIGWPRRSRPRRCGSTGTAARSTGSPATTSCTSASRTTCAG